MGLGKTYTGAEKLIRLGAKVNLVICQKSKVNDWVEHFREHYENESPFCLIHDLTKTKVKDINSSLLKWCKDAEEHAFPHVYVINYDLLWRRPKLKELKDFTLMLDESSLIQNRNSKRSKFILNLHPSHVILLSGTPCSGKYELLWSQLHLLGWKISEETYWNQYIDTHYEDVNGFPLRIVDGYKNVERLKRKMREHGCHFLKTDEVIDLPDRVFQKVYVPVTTVYKKFMRDRIITVGDKELVGDTTLTKLLYARMLCGTYNAEKLEAFRDLIESTDDRVIVFYNFNEELEKLMEITEECGKEISFVNGSGRSMCAYEEVPNSVTFVQYQSGAKGLNLQKAFRMVFFTPPLSVENYMQSMKRIHRINQQHTCFYYQLICKGSVEEKIYAALQKGEDYTNLLFEYEGA